MWGYATVAGLLGVIEAFWWGGKGWFMPGFGTLLLLLGALPSNWMVHKLLSRRRTTTPSFRGLFAIGLLQGLGMFPMIEIVSSLVKFAVSTTSMVVHGYAELIFIALDLTIGLAMSTLASTLIVVWFYPRGLAHAERDKRRQTACHPLI
jgi:hypothetical protein